MENRVEQNTTSIMYVLQQQNFTSNTTAKIQEPFYNVAINIQKSLLDILVILSTIILLGLIIYRRGGEYEDYQRKVRNYQNLSKKVLSYDPIYVRNQKKILEDFLTPENYEETSILKSYLLTVKDNFIYALQAIYYYLKPHNPHSSLESFWEFFFPQRFITGWILTLVTGLISLYFCFFLVLNGCALTIYGSIMGVKFYLQLCKLPIGLPICIVGEEMLQLIIAIIFGAVYAVIIVPITVSVCWLLYSLISVPMEYKRRIHGMRHGEYRFEKTKIDPFNATRYIGYIIGNVLSGVVVLYTFLVAVIVFFGFWVGVFTIWPGIWSWFRENYLAPFLSVTIPAIVLRFLVVWFLAKLLVRGTWYRFLTFFSYVDIFMMFYSSVTGILSSLFYGIFLPVVYRAFTMIRPDRTLYAHDSSWDPMYSAYLSTLYTDHCHNNPLLLTLGERYLKASTPHIVSEFDITTPLKEARHQFRIFKILRVLWILKSTKLYNKNNVRELLNEVQLDEIKESFSILNLQNGLQVKLMDVFYAFRSMGFPVTKESVQDMIKLTAIEISKKLDFEEFLALLKFSLAPLSNDEIKDFYESMDVEQTGFISHDALKNIMFEFDRFRAYNDLTEMFEESNISNGITIEHLYENINLNL